MSKIPAGFFPREFGPDALSVQQTADTPDLVKEASQC